MDEGEKIRVTADGSQKREGEEGGEKSVKLGSCFF